MSSPERTTSTNTSTLRTDLNGVWVLDRKRGSPSVRGFLETMGVNELAIEANEKGDDTHDTIHEIRLTSEKFIIRKQSRVNDMTLEVTLGEEHIKPLLPGERLKKTMATSSDTCHVKVESSMPTMNGVARVSDVKSYSVETGPDGRPFPVYTQQLTILNESTGKSNVTTRYFVPHDGNLGPAALTAGGNNRKS